MGLKDGNAKINYLRIREHKFLENGKEKTKYGFAFGKEDMPHSTLEGRIIKLFYKDEKFEKTNIRKLIVVVFDGKETFQFGLNVASSSYSSFVSFLKNADINQPLEIVPRLEYIPKDGTLVSRRSILIRQNGVWLKSYYTNANRNGLPKWEEKEFNGSVVLDKTASIKFLENVVLKEIVPKMDYVPQPDETSNNTDYSSEALPKAPTEDLPFDNVEDDLPF